MKMPVHELVDDTLAWAVAKCIGFPEFALRAIERNELSHADEPFDPASHWSQAGPIIEREGIDLYQVERGSPLGWEAEIQTAPGQRARAKGSTPLLAAMRCLVLARLGPEIEVPDALCEPAMRVGRRFS